MCKKLYFVVFLIGSISIGCHQNDPARLFTKLSKSDTGIDFRNLIIEKETFSIFKYQYFYNGGGVAVGDFNNDGLQDLFFTGNMVKNRMYLNKGHFNFDDITAQAGIAEKEGWCTGAVPVDINADGWLDLYICRAGFPFDDIRYNLLYINDGAATPHFTEQSAAYGLNDLGHTTQASFFDYDRDGDLDVFLLNHSTVEYSRGSLEVIPLRQKTHPEFSNKLLRNDGGRYIDVTQEAGIYANVLTFSLGIHIADVNKDFWPDIFIGNDFNEPDYLFINQQNGTFVDEIKTRLDHTSMFTMGVDFADYNNDGFLDFASLDMLPESNHLQKMHAGVDNFDKLTMLSNAGLLKQFSRNMLQRNNGDGTFTEIAQMAGVSNTDWSWSPLFFDFDNDGFKDLFISNGYLRDHTDMDFLKFTADEVLKIQAGKESVNFEEYLEKMPSISQSNYFFQNKGDGYHFDNRTADWGDPQPGVSQGAAYADLDNDGDLDLVINNSNDYAGVYQNNSERIFQHHYLKISLKGQKNNPIGIGTQITAHTGKQLFYLEQNPVRGFQTSVDPILHLGLGQIQQLDSLVVIWPTGEKQVVINVKADQTLELDQRQATIRQPGISKKSAPFFVEKPDWIPFKHSENPYNDFKMQLLLPYFYSRPGPAMASADVNGDQREDVYVGGAAGQSGQLYIQMPDGRFKPDASAVWQQDATAEDVDATFVDVDQDGDLDLLVASGAYEAALPDRVYLNEQGLWVNKGAQASVLSSMSSGCVRSVRGLQQSFVFQGSGVKPGRFPEKNGLDAVAVISRSGEVQFIPLSLEGLCTDAIWVNICGDENPDLVIAVEWGALQVFENKTTQFVARPDLMPKEAMAGLWQCIQSADLDGDGDLDLIAGNIGQNTPWKVDNVPLELYAGDFDANGSIDPLLFYGVQGKSYAFPAMEDLLNQVPPMKKKFIYFKDYADAGVTDILNEQQIKEAISFKVNQLSSVVLINEGGRFQMTSLPWEAQVAPICALAVADINHDGFQDIVSAGGFSMVKVRLGNLQGNHGLVLLGDGKGAFRAASREDAGLKLSGDVRKLLMIRVGKEAQLWVGINNHAVRVFQHQ
jgi:hypothetical protein